MGEEVQNTRHAFHNQKVSMKHGLQPINRNMNKLLWRWPYACYAPTDGVCFLLLRSSCPRIWNHQTRRNWRNTLRHDEWEMMPRRQRCFLESLFRLKMWNLWEPFGSLILVMQSLALVQNTGTDSTDYALTPRPPYLCVSLRKLSTLCILPKLALDQPSLPITASTSSRNGCM